MELSDLPAKWGSVVAPKAGTIMQTRARLCRTTPVQKAVLKRVTVIGMKQHMTLSSRINPSKKALLKKRFILDL